MKRIFFTIIIVLWVLVYFPTPVSAAITSLTPFAEFTGETAGDKFGFSVSAAGDVNNDGYDDFMIGTMNYNSYQGRVYIFYGSSSLVSKSANSADAILTGVTGGGVLAGDLFGCSISSVGDINNDGYDDIIVGARGYSGGILDGVGRAYIFYGSASGIATGDANSADVILTGEAISNRFASSVASAGDVNKDGYKDIIIGAGGAEAGLGRAYIFYGGPSLATKNAALADVIFSGEVPNTSFNVVSSTGDVNADGYDDVIVGAPNYSTWTGRAYIFYGSSSMGNKGAGSADVILTGEATSNQFADGNLLSSLGDINKDGYDDIIVGAALNDTIDTEAGRAYIFYGGPSLTTKNANLADIILDGESGNDNFGRPDLVNDINNDGYNDVIVGAAGYPAGSYKGRIYIFYGGLFMNSFTDVTIDGMTDGDYFGLAISSVGDVNNDGWQEFLVAACGYSSYTGRIYLYNLNYASPNVSFDAIGNIQVTSTEVTGTATQSGANLAGVQVRIDGGEWIDCEADDGTFDEENEEFSCSLSGLEGGEHTVEVRSYDENGVYIPSTLFARETFSVELSETGGDIYYLVILGVVVLVVLTRNYRRTLNNYRTALSFGGLRIDKCTPASELY